MCLDDKRRMVLNKENMPKVIHTLFSGTNRMFASPPYNVYRHIYVTTCFIWDADTHPICHLLPCNEERIFPSGAGTDSRQKLTPTPKPKEHPSTYPLLYKRPGPLMQPEKVDGGWLMTSYVAMLSTVATPLDVTWASVLLCLYFNSHSLRPLVFLVLSFPNPIHRRRWERHTATFLLM